MKNIVTIGQLIVVLGVFVFVGYMFVSGGQINTGGSNLPSHQTAVVTHLTDAGIATGFSRKLAQSLPVAIGEYTLLTYGSAAAESGQTAEDLDLTDGITPDLPILQVYDCDSKRMTDEYCPEQVWVTYTSADRMTQIVFFNFTKNAAAAVNAWLGQDEVRKKPGQNIYESKDTYVMWAPKTDFDLIMSKSTTADGGYESDLSGDDAVTRYFLNTFSPE